MTFAKNRSVKTPETAGVNAPDFEVAIIGAGFGGLGMGIRLKRAGQDDFVIFERAAELGGTWRDNVYPGCACDVPSLVYSFSFDQNPNWSRKYASQPEILAYLKQCAERFDVGSHIRFNAEVTYLAFDEAAGYWHVSTRDGDSVTAGVVVLAMGPLNRPNIPALPGADTFAGEAFHSSQWDPDFRPEGKRIAVMGTGASAIQIVPALAGKAAQLYVLQRTPPWILPRDDRPRAELVRRLFRRVPAVQSLARILQYWMMEIRVLSFLGNEFMNRAGTNLARKHLEQSVANPELRQALTPDYKLGCKRVLSSDDYYPALQQSDVELVTAGVDWIEADAIVSTDGQVRPVDAIIFATGFVASEFLLDMKICGRNGRELLAEWQETGPEAYLGLSVSGYPNLFFVLGPNTGLGHNSVLHMMESQYNYILDYLRLLEQEGVAYLDVKPEAQAQFNDDLQARLATTVWQAGGCKSWYQTAAGKNTTLWPGSTAGYRLRTRGVDAAAYEWDGE